MADQDIDASLLAQANKCFLQAKSLEVAGMLDIMVSKLHEATELYMKGIGSSNSSVATSIKFLVDFINVQIDAALDGCLSISRCGSEDSVYNENHQHKAPFDKRKPAACSTESLRSESSTSLPSEGIEKAFESKIQACPPGGFDCLTGMADVKRALAVSLFMRKPDYQHLFPGCGREKNNVLLYGVPGTGKSKIAYAYAAEAKLPYIEIRPSDVLSRYIGDSEGKLNALFSVLGKRAPAVVFIDEIDGIFGGSEKTPNTANLINEFLIHAEKPDDVQIIAATNFPWMLHESVRRRFQTIIHVPLPSRAERFHIMKKFLSEAGVSMPDLVLDDVANRTVGYSGSDMKRLVQYILKLPWMKIQKANWFKAVHTRKDLWWTPCEPNEEGAKETKFVDLPPSRIQRPLLTAEDFVKGVGEIKKTVNADDENGKDFMKKMADFTRRYGQTGI